MRVRTLHNVERIRDAQRRQENRARLPDVKLMYFTEYRDDRPVKSSRYSFSGLQLGTHSIMQYNTPQAKPTHICREYQHWEEDEINQVEH